MPVETVFLRVLVHRAAQKLPEHLEVDLARLSGRPLGERFWKQSLQTFQVLGDIVRRASLRVVGIIENNSLLCT